MNVHHPLFPGSDDGYKIDWAKWFPRFTLEFWPGFNDRIYMIVDRQHALAIVMQQTIGM